MNMHISLMQTTLKFPLEKNKQSIPECASAYWIYLAKKKPLPYHNKFGPYFLLPLALPECKFPLEWNKQSIHECVSAYRTYLAERKNIFIVIINLDHISCCHLVSLSVLATHLYWIIWARGLSQGSLTHHSLMKVILCQNVIRGIDEVSLWLQSTPYIECLNISLKSRERYGSWRITPTATYEILKHFNTLYFIHYKLSMVDPHIDSTWLWSWRGCRG